MASVSSYYRRSTGDASHIPGRCFPPGLTCRARWVPWCCRRNALRGRETCERCAAMGWGRHWGVPWSSLWGHEALCW
eukprot:2442245-Pyramimonas_sp.AAC.1